jgi:hypothetical protein
MRTRRRISMGDSIQRFVVRRGKGLNGWMRDFGERKTQWAQKGRYEIQGSFPLPFTPFRVRVRMTAVEGGRVGVRG